MRIVEPAATQQLPTEADAERWITEQRAEAGRLAIEQKGRKVLAQGPKPFHQPQERQQFFLDQRAPQGRADWVYPIESVQTVLEKLKLREATLQRNRGAVPGSITSWQELGPGNIGGRTRALVFDPVDPNIMYAGGVSGGVWKTIDAGESWSATDDLMLNLAVVSLAVDPNDRNVLYAGTGEGVFAGGSPGLGIFTSDDAGATWTQLAGTVSGVPTGSFHYVNKVVISPNDSNRIYAGMRTGVWRSLDAGQNWSLVLGNPTYQSATWNSNGSLIGCTDLQVRPDSNPDQVWATFGSNGPDGLFRSDDAGNSWVTYGVPASQGRMTIAFAPSNNDIMYLLMADNGTGGQFGQLVNVYRSVDGGLNWTGRVDFSSLTGPWLLSNLSLATACLEGFPVYSQGWYDNIIAVDPSDPDIVWVGGVDIFRSDDGGQNFEIPAYWFFYTFDPLPPYFVHADHHMIQFHPEYDGTTNQIMYATNDGGIFRTTNAKAATSLEDCPLPGDLPLPEIVWEPLNNGYGVTQFYHGDSARNIDMFVAGAQDNGTNRGLSRDPAQDWDLIYGGDGGYVNIDPTNSDVLYIELFPWPSILKSTDGGATFADAITGITDGDGLFITPIAMDQANPDVLWTGGRRPWRTTNAAGSWEVVGPDFGGPATISAIAIAPSNSNIVYLGFNKGYVVRSTNALDADPSWTIFANGLFGAHVSSIAVDPIDADTAYLTYSTFGVPHVLRTINGGQNWQSIDGISMTGVPDIPAHWIAVRPCNSLQLYVATELGLFVSNDGGSTWNPANDGFVHTIVESLDWKDENTLVAFTHGRGAFLATLVPCNSCTGNTNGDTVVDVFDLLDLLGAWGACDLPCPPSCAADSNADCVVDVFDLLDLLAAWGDCP